MALQTGQIKNNLEEMRRAVAKKFPGITSLRSFGGVFSGSGGKENSSAGAATGSTELVAMEPPQVYEFGARSNNAIYTPSTHIPSPPGPAALKRQVR